MGTPIISPKLIYFLETFGDIKKFLFLLLIAIVIISFVAILMAAIAADTTYSSDEKEKYVKFIKKIFKYFILPTIVIMFLSLFIPSKKTMYMMFVGKNITYENIKLGKEEILKTVEEISEILNKKGKE